MHALVDHIKNFKQKRSALGHRQLTVRIPTVILQKATIKNLVELQQRIDRYRVPKGWVEIADQRSSDYLFLTRLSKEQATDIKIDHFINSFCCGSVKSNCRGNDESITCSISTKTNTHLHRRKSRKRQYEENCHSVPETNDTPRGI